ncbi:putative uncharacterized protein GUCA1ANB [Carassius gibelio]|uniref:putative uncharacterized protein GUCA1ANB n=1 Tax=Carassius gibelio TaxID=101364 RepID=UPI0022791D35|nr:putative uncharacterized protein GUCA1ANB [Carassius gibelio]
MSSQTLNWDQMLTDRQKTSTCADMMKKQTRAETQRTRASAEMHDIRSVASPPERVQTHPDTSRNSLRPFYTAQKPACGFSFSWSTDHRRKHNGLQACDPVKWRSQCVSRAQ